MKLTAKSKRLAQELLDWDIARVAGVEARGFDASVYRDRQRAAQAALAADSAPKKWPREVLDLFMTVLEVTMSATPAGQYGVGPLDHPVAEQDDDRRRLLRKLARELGVIQNLLEVAPRQWADEKEGA